MTVINLAVAGTPLTSDNKRAMADQMTEAFAAVEVGNDNPMIRAGFMVHFEQLAADDLWLGAQQACQLSDSGRAAVITIRVMAGPWTDDMKAELFKRIESIVRDVADTPKQGNGADIWMTFLEVPEGSWGLGGRTVSIAAIAPVFQADRQERIQEYLKSHH